MVATEEKSVGEIKGCETKKRVSTKGKPPSP